MNDEILFEVRGKAGFVTLNRPKALNALTHDKVKALALKLELWADDPNVRHVVIRGAGGKAFCAGGDIRSIYDARQAGELDGLKTFFRDEYTLNAYIKAYRKPYIALIDGIVMGGGVGVSVHGSHRVGTENMLFSMPETGIGFFPDVGGTYFLPRMPGSIGTYCALSAGRLKQADALFSGVLTHAIAQDRLPELQSALETTDDVDATLEGFRVSPASGPVQKNAELIEHVFSASSVEEVLSRLDASGDEFAIKTAAAIRGKSPTSVLIAFEQMKRGALLDFFEGIRAVVVDKDQSPKWNPNQLAQVDRAGLASYFEEPFDGDLPL